MKYRADRWWGKRGATMPRCVLAVACALPLMAALPAQAADDYPSRPIRLVIPYPAGGTADIMARNFSEYLGRELGQTIVPENKPGAAGQLGTLTAAKAAPDGYTLGQSNAGTFEVSPYLYKSLPYNTKTDFTQIAVMGRMGLVLAVSAESPYKTLADLMGAAKQHPDRYSFATPGVGTSNHLAGTLLASRAGFEWMHVPFKGVAEFLPAVLGGQVTALIDQYPSLMKQLEAGKVRGLAVSTGQRIPSAPDIPTFKEAGLPDFEFYAWFALMLPKGVPQPIVDKLAAASRRVVQNPEYRARITRLGAEPSDLMLGDLQNYIDTDSQIWKKVIEDNKISIDN